MSIGTGFPGVGAECANRRGKSGRLAEVDDWAERVMAEGIDPPGGRDGLLEARKAALAAWFWSMRTAASYHASGSRSSGRPVAMVATASAMAGFRPWRNLTTMVFGSV